MSTALVATAGGGAPTNKVATLGGWEPVNPYNKNVQEIAEFAVNEYNKKTCSKLRLVDIVKGEKQIVSGVNYKLVLAVKEIEWDNIHNFEAFVYEKSWEHYRELISFFPLYDSNAPKKTIVGGWEPIEHLHDKHVQEIAEFAVTEYNKLTHSYLKLADIIRGWTQVVAGVNYKLIIETKGHHTYETVVNEKSWEHTKVLVSFYPLAE